MPSVITLTGPSGSGKSTALGYLLRLSNKDFQPVLVPKYTTRHSRRDDYGEAVSVRTIPKTCDLVYEQYGVRYGLRVRTLFDHLAKGESPVVILNDVRTVQDVRTALGPLVRSIFVFREHPSLETQRRLAEARDVRDEDDVRRRFDKAQAIYRIYIENIQLFDHVIINSGSRRPLKSQVHQIIEGLSHHRSWPLH